jgi:hypothetical protein
LLAYSWLVAVPVLQNIRSFLGGPSDGKHSDVDTSRSHGYEDQLSQRIFSLFPHQRKNEHQEFPDLTSRYELAITIAFRLFYTGSEILLEKAGDDTVVWRIFNRQIDASGFYVRFVDTMSKSRSVFETSDGYIGLGPDTIQTGDCVVILPGVGVPYLARPVGSGLYTLLGEVYVPGIMYGELFEEQKVSRLTWMEFC